jgi:thiol-disulfide isomerase/thioredoxin
MPLRARRLLAAAAAALAAAATLSACAGQDAVDQTAGASDRFVAGDGTVVTPAVGHRPKAPEVIGTLLGGRRFNLAGHRGHVVVFNVWGSWCAPCRAEAPDLERVYRKTRASGVQFVGVNIRDTKATARAFDRTFHVTYPSIFDPAGRFVLQFRQLPPSTIPATVVVDRDGRIAALFRKPLLASDLLPVVRRIAGERA